MFKQKTAYEMRISDWSSDVCSSDLLLAITALTIVVVTKFHAAAGDQASCSSERNESGIHAVIEQQHPEHLDRHSFAHIPHPGPESSRLARRQPFWNARAARVADVAHFPGGKIGRAQV